MADSRSLREASDTLTVPADGGMECVFHARSASEAERHRSILEGYGIATRLGGEPEDGGVAVNALAGLPLFVPTFELERASEILARCDIEGAEWDEEDDLEDEEEEDEEDEEEEEDDYFPEDDDEEEEEEAADDDL